MEESNASDLVVHTGPAVSPPNDIVGAKQFYIHYHQIDHNRVLSGTRTFELVNPEWKFPYHIVHLNRTSGALVVPKMTFHRSMSGDDGSIVINHFLIRDDEFNPDTEFIPFPPLKTKTFTTSFDMKNPSSTTSENKFPFEGFPVRLEIYEGKGKQKTTRVCHFHV